MKGLILLALASFCIALTNAAPRPADDIISQYYDFWRSALPSAGKKVNMQGPPDNGDDALAQYYNYWQNALPREMKKASEQTNSNDDALAQLFDIRRYLPAVNKKAMAEQDALPIDDAGDDLAKKMASIMVSDHIMQMIGQVILFCFICRLL